MSDSALIRNLKPVTLASASPAQHDMLDKAVKQVGFLPNMYANMVNAPAVLSTYLHGYGLFRSESGFAPAEQEVVFLAISQANGCKYCTAAHSMVADKMSGVPADVLNSIRNGLPIENSRLATLFQLTQDVVKTHGKPCANLVKAFWAAGFDEKHLLYIVLAVSVKTLSNYTNHLFQTQLDDVFAAYKLP